ncbi:cell separation during budding, partial [Quaeritorhiza haematococci]
EISDIVKRALADRQGVPVKFISNLSRQNPLVAVHITSPVLDAVQQFVSHKRHNGGSLHRVVVVEPTDDGKSNKFVGVLSQSTVAAFIASKVGKLSHRPPSAGSGVAGGPEVSWPLGDKSIQDMGLVKGNVFHVTPEDSVLDALYKMHTQAISSVAILDHTPGYPQLVGNISMTDIKSILSSRGGWRKLYDNAFRFFVELRAAQGLEDGRGNDRAPNFVVHPGTSLIMAVEKMAATRTHRVWVVEGVDKCVGVVSLSDIMPLLLK